MSETGYKIINQESMHYIILQNLVPEGSNYQYKYDLTDHLGNVRVSFTDTDNDGVAEVIQENHYYPFGLTFDGLNYYNRAHESKLKFNGKELTDEHGLNWYDFGARMYDPAMQYASPYKAIGNNPINSIDPPLPHDCIVWFNKLRIQQRLV